MPIVTHAADAPATTTNAATAGTPPPPPPPPKHRPIIFHAPSGVSDSVMPNTRGGGSRANKDGLGNVFALAPDKELGETTEAQPTFYVYLTKPVKTYCELTVTEPKHPKPVLVKQTAVSEQAGILAFRMSKFGVELKPGVVYKWSIAIVVEPNSRSQDIIAWGVVKRVDPTPELTSDLANANDADKAAVYADKGIWYDAMDSISEQIIQHPDDASLRQERESLLEAVGVQPGDVAESAPPAAHN